MPNMCSGFKEEYNAVIRKYQQDGRHCQRHAIMFLGILVYQDITPCDVLASTMGANRVGSFPASISTNILAAAHL